MINKFLHRSTSLASKPILNYIAVLTVIVILFIAMEIMSRPVGNFPLNDDWSYARSVKNLLEYHKLTITDWTLTAAITPIVLATIFCSITGLTFETLRICSIICSLITVVATAYLLGRYKVSPGFLFLALLLLICNPLFFCLSNTFMTDVPTLAILAMSFCSYFLCFLRPTFIKLFAATVLSCALCLSRQVLILAPISFFLAGLSITTGRSITNKSKYSFLLPALASLACIFIHSYWLVNVPGLPYCYRVEQIYLYQQYKLGFFFLIPMIIQRIFIALLYLGLFLLPILISFLPTMMAKHSKKTRVFLILLSIEIGVLLCGGCLLTHAFMPLADNVIYDIGLGPMIMPGPPSYKANPIFWLVVTICSATGCGLLVSYLISSSSFVLTAIKTKTFKNTDLFTVFCFYFLLLYLFTICLRGFFDRYLIFVIPTILFIIANLYLTPPNISVKPNHIAFSLGLMSVIAMGTLSIIGTHDYFSWNRARWQALNYATKESKINPIDIDGGLEFNGWTSSDPAAGGKAPVTNTRLSRGDSYLVTLGPTNNYVTIKQFPFKRWYPIQTDYIYLQKKQDKRQ